MTHFIVTCGLTRRLVEADSREDAVLAFMTDRPMRMHFGGLEEWLEVHEATELEIVEFTSRRWAPIIDGQLEIELDDERTKTKDHQ